MKNYNDVVWDWNGTLLDDVDISIATVNDILRRRGLPPTDREKYFRDFEMPVIRYYENAGFDFSKEPFAVIAAEFTEGYAKRVRSANLAAGAVDVLNEILKSGIRQTIISSSEQESLAKIVGRFGISEYFSEILGKGDHLAEGKSDIAQDWLERTKADPRRTLLIGDLVYDMEVAAEIGCDCVLIGNGHQGRIKIGSCGADMLDNIKEVPKYIGIR